MPWYVNLLPLDGGVAVQVDAPFRAGSVTWDLDGPGSFEFDLSYDDVAGGDWLYGRRRVEIKDPLGNSKLVGWLEHLDRGGAPRPLVEGADYRAAGRGLSVVLFQRIVHGAENFTAVPANTIVSSLLAHAKAQTSGSGPDLLAGFSMGTVFNGPAPARSKYYCDGDNIGEAIQALGEMGTGYAWEVAPDGTLDMWIGGRGTDLSATVSFDETDVQDFSVSADTAEFATYATGLGDRDDDSPCGPPLVIDFTSLRDEYGRREVVVESEASTEPDMEEITTEELRARQASRLNVEASWIEGMGPWAFGDVWLGDRVSVDTGVAFEGVIDMRLVTVTANFEGLHTFVNTTWEAV